MNLKGMMQQVQDLQVKGQEMQAELETIEVTGTAGAGLVTITLNGKAEVRGVVIDPSLMKPEEVEIVEDLVAAAIQDAKTKVDRLVQEKMQAITGGLPIPPDLKLF